MSRLLLDENFPASAVGALVAAGHDVVCLRDVDPGIPDHGVLALAREQGRVLLTFDSDFGELVFRRGEAPPLALLYFRMHPIVAVDVAALALAVLDMEVTGWFLVVGREGVRQRRLPSRHD